MSAPLHDPHAARTDDRPLRPRVVIVGGGFAGLAAARGLRSLDADVILVDRSNHHLFQPLLYQAATAAVSPGDIAAPIRFLLRRQRNTRVLMAEVTGIDVDRREVRFECHPSVLRYDYLIVAAGTSHAYFAHPEWAALAPGLKTVEDAITIRNRFLTAFERAECCRVAEERQSLMTFVVVGGGPTGVELAGVMPVIARQALARDFRSIDTRQTRVILLEAGPRILPALAPSLSDAALRDLTELGVEVHLDTAVTAIEPGIVHAGARTFRTSNVFWAAGNQASALGRRLGVPVDRAGRVPVQPDLSVAGHPDVFVAGDLAAVESGGVLVPGVAPAAVQMGHHAAATIARELAGRPRRTFRYRDKGTLATIGRHRAVADFGRLRFTGSPAWLLWLFVHILYLVGFRNRVAVLMNWAYAYFTFERGVRLIHTTDGRSGSTANRAGPGADRP